MTKKNKTKYKIIKKYAGSKPVGTILTEQDLSISPERYPEYFKKLN